MTAVSSRRRRRACRWSQRPYHAVASELGIPPEDVIRRLHRMLEAGIIRRIGAVPNHYVLGYRANGMSVWDVPDEDVAGIGRRVGALRLRQPLLPTGRAICRCWPYNLFAMVHGRTRARSRPRWPRSPNCSAPPTAATTVLYSTRILKKTGLRIAG